MIVLDVDDAAAFLKTCKKNARSLIKRLPHGNVSRSEGPNEQLRIAQETLEKFVLGEIKPVPIGSEGEIIDIPKPRRKQYKYEPSKNGPIPKRAYR